MYMRIINDLGFFGFGVLFFFLMLAEKYPPEKEALMLELYSSGSAELKQVK